MLLFRPGPLILIGVLLAFYGGSHVSDVLHEAAHGHMEAGRLIFGLVALVPGLIMCFVLLRAVLRAVCSLVWR